MKNYSYSFFILFLLVYLIRAQQSKLNTYSTIVESYGYAEKQSNVKMTKIQEQAYDDAKRNILEKTMIHVKSYSRVVNFKLESDFIQSESEGYLRILEKKDLGFNKDNRYCVWIKAEVIYTFDHADHTTDKQVIDAPLTVKIRTDKEKYTLSDKVKIFLMPNKDCFLLLIYKDAENNILQIFPNQRRKNNFFKGNILYSIPADSDLFEFTVTPPFGKETITVFASTSQLGRSTVNKYGNDFYKFNGDEKQFSIKTRGVKITDKTVPAEFFQASCNIAVVTNSDN